MVKLHGSAEAVIGRDARALKTAPRFCGRSKTVNTPPRASKCWRISASRLLPIGAFRAPHPLAAMANPLRQRLGALLSRPAASNSSHTSPGAVTKRFFAAKSHEHDDAEETSKWRSVTIAAYVVCICLGAYTLSHEEHGHSEYPQYSYLHIRNKEFPWGPDGLFEYKHEDHEEH